MILDGDILAYFDEMGIDVEESTYEDTFSFIFKISYGSFDLEFEKAHQDTSIEEDMAELMSLLRKKR